MQRESRDGSIGELVIGVQIAGQSVRRNLLFDPTPSVNVNAPPSRRCWLYGLWTVNRFMYQQQSQGDVMLFLQLLSIYSNCAF